MSTFTDHLGRSVQLPVAPQRIISLCPSQTETLYALGLGARIVGRTRFCIHPAEEVKNAVVVGGTKKVNMERIAELEPDLIIGEKEENTKEMVEELEARWPVYVTDVRSPGDAVRMVRDLGMLAGKAARGEVLAGEVEAALGRLPKVGKGRKCLYFIWRGPWMVAGKDTFIDGMLSLLGFENVVQEGAGRYPEVDAEWIAGSGAEVVLLSSEPFPFSGKHISEIREMVGEQWIELVDGEMFSWYGSRLLDAPYYFGRWE